MNTPFQRMAQSPPGIGKVVVGKKPEPEPGKVGVKVKAAIFFDGTGNNQSNIKKRLKDSSYMTPGWFTSDDSRASYAQYYSNVAILYFMHKKNVPGERIASVYVEGIGTANDEDDDTPGSGFGSGPTGIVDRVSKGIGDLRKAVKDLLKPNKGEYLEELTVYAFGFSRGAAAARHFCARRADSRGRANNLCQALGVEKAVVTIKFVGLFDSVSSFDETGDEPGDAGWKAKAARHARDGDKEFRNDVAELHLTLSPDPQVVKVVHLVAADEYRVNFSLTTIASALRQGKGFELRLPGAHSDIGGGYAQTLTETLTYSPTLRTLSALPFFRDRGWYGEGQVEDHSFRTRSGQEALFVGTRQLPNTYQYVALGIMLKLAMQSGMLLSSPNTDEERGIRYVIAPGSRLFAVKTHLEDYALSHAGGAHAEALTAPMADAHYRWLRQHYLHLSWKDKKLGFEFRRDQQGTPFRLVLAG